jgi:hypothetical protein
MKKKKLITEKVKNKFYLYNPIPIVKQEAVVVIQDILKSRNLNFEWGENVDLNTFDVVNRMRFKDYINRVVKYKEIRGHAIEGLMAGLFGGILNESKSGVWDYEIRQGQVEQKFLNDSTESPSIGGFTNALNSLGADAIATIKNTLSKNRPEITGTNLFLVNDDEITEYKKEILRKILVDITCITIDSGDRLKTYYLTKENAIELFSDAKNIKRPRKVNSNELRVSSDVFINDGNSFDIIKAKVKPEEYKEYIEVTQRDEEVSKIFGPYGGKIRPDILNWIDKNKEEFKNLVNTLL